MMRFPGMDPYLENPGLWPEVHSRLLVAIADVLGPQLRPKYRVAIEKRVYEDVTEGLAIDRPDAIILQTPAQEPFQPDRNHVVAVAEPVTVELIMPEIIQERYLEIREVGTERVVTTLELLSPSNKRPGRGRQEYLEKRSKIFSSQTHLVEIDLIRAFQPLPLRGNSPKSLYRILISRAQHRPRATLYPFNLSTPIPTFPLPLQSEDAEPIVDLQTLLAQLYDRASYDLAIDYTRETIPPLTESDRPTADRVLQQTC